MTFKFLFNSGAERVIYMETDGRLTKEELENTVDALMRSVCSDPHAAFTGFDIVNGCYFRIKLAQVDFIEAYADSVDPAVVASA